MRHESIDVSMQFVRYCTAGAVAGATLLAVLALLVETTSIEPVVASAVSFAVAILLNYALQYRFTFEANDGHGSALPKFGAVACCGLAINTGLFWLVHSVAGIPYLLAQIATTGAVVLFNYSMARRFVFVEQRR